VNQQDGAFVPKSDDQIESARNNKLRKRLVYKPAEILVMKRDEPSENEQLRQPKPGVIDQRQQQIDPAGKQRVDKNWRPDSNRKQPGESDPRECKEKRDVIT
jgi:hypothetical protein